MIEKTWLEEKFESWSDDIDFIVEEKIIEFTERIVQEMEKKQINRSELAKSLGKSKSFVTKILKGDNNMTIKSMVAVAQALDSSLHLDLYPKRFYARTLFVSDSRSFEPVDLSYMEGDQHACAA